MSISTTKPCSGPEVYLPLMLSPEPLSVRNSGLAMRSPAPELLALLSDGNKKKRGKVRERTRGLDIHELTERHRNLLPFAAAAAAAQSIPTALSTLCPERLWAPSRTINNGTHCLSVGPQCQGRWGWGCGWGVIFRVRSPNDSNAAPSGVGVGGADAEDESHILGDATVAGTFSHFLIFFPWVFATVCLDWMLHDPNSRVARMMCHLFIPFFFFSLSSSSSTPHLHFRHAHQPPHRFRPFLYAFSSHGAWFFCHVFFYY